MEKNFSSPPYLPSRSFPLIIYIWMTIPTTDEIQACRITAAFDASFQL